jgi:hypothetical protein
MIASVERGESRARLREGDEKRCVFENGQKETKPISFGCPWKFRSPT